MSQPIKTGLLSVRNYVLRGGYNFQVEQYRPMLNSDSYDIRTSTQFIAVHCADTAPDFRGDVADIRGWHINERKWEDVGYHYVITRAGVIQTGRPHWAKGANVEGFNSHTLGICLMGGKQSLDVNPSEVMDLSSHHSAASLYTQAQMASLAFLLANLKFHGEADYSKFRGAAKLDRKYSHDYYAADIRGHRDFMGVTKTCPNFDVKRWLADFMPHTGTTFATLRDYVVPDFGG